MYKLLLTLVILLVLTSAPAEERAQIINSSNNAKVLTDGSFKRSGSKGEENDPVQAVLTFEPLKDRYVGDSENAHIDLVLRAQSTNDDYVNSPILFTSSDTAIVAIRTDEGNFVMQIKKAGTVTITASQNGNSLYIAPQQLSRTVKIHPRITDSLYIMNQDSSIQKAKIKINGGATFGTVTLTDNLKTSSPGNYDMLTRNNVTGLIERISSGTAAGADSTLVSTSQQYTNPSWINSLSWSKLTERPNTLGGYGITDAAPLVGGTNYIQNQSALAQSASIFIDGKAIIGNDLAVDEGLEKPALDIRANASNKISAVFARLPEASQRGPGTYLGVKGYSTNVNSKSFSLQHSFGGEINNSINFYRGSSYQGGFITFNTHDDSERMRISNSGNVLINSVTDDGVNKLQVSGSIKSSGGVEANTFTIKVQPVVSSGEFEVLTRNKATGAVERTSFPAYTDAAGNLSINEENIVHRTNDEVISGVKNFVGLVGFGSAVPRARFDVSSPLTGGELGAVLGRLSEGNASGNGTFLGVRGYSTTDVNVKSFGLEHGFYGQVNSSINFYRGDHTQGGFLTFHTNDNREQMRLSKAGNLIVGYTTDDNINKLQVNGNIKAQGLIEAGHFTIKMPPVASASSFELLTRNTVTGAIEKTSPETVLDQTNLVHTTGDELIAGVKTFSGNIHIGTPNPGTYSLTVKGTIKAQAIKVDPTNWYDHVFAREYKLPPLSDVEKFVIENQHLPDIPSEAEVQKHGIELGKMNALLLKKIEELTLYMIEKDKEVSELKQRLNRLEKKP